MAVERVDMDSKELFEAAISDDSPAETQAAPQPEEVTAEQPEGQPRDEQGRFASTREPEQPQPTEQPVAQAQPPAQDAIPPWRLKEEADARRAAEARIAALEREVRQGRVQLQQFTEKKAEPIDPYLDPEKFRDVGIEQRLNPLVQQLAQQREYFSRKAAVASHGEKAVVEAYEAFKTAAQTGDPNAQVVMQKVMSSLDPFEEIVTWHKHNTVLKDPRSWAMSQVGEWAKDPAAKAQILAALGQQPAPSEKPSNVVKLPPSLNKAAGTAQEPVGTLSSEDLYAHAIGRT